MITKSYWNSQPCSLEVSFHGGNTFPVSRCGTLCSLDGKSHLFHKDGAVSKPVQFSEAAGSAQKRIISLLWANSLESPKVSQCICYSYLCEILVSMSIWNRRSKERSRPSS